jgi:monofunctional glycosyltransferase
MANRLFEKFKVFWSQRSRWQRWALGTCGCLAGWPVVMTLVYGVLPVPFSNLMVLRLFGGNGFHKSWVSLDKMSPYLTKAVVSSEDQRFCFHHGVDWVEFHNATGSGKARRGASTISMQTAKNMFLWDGRSYIRKGLELPLAYYMDGIWTKRRMMEVYLNIVEWAPGIYGAEAAAKYHFKKSASQLTRREAALLAAVLPNPILRTAGKPSGKVKLLANRIMLRMVGMDAYVACLK